MVCARCGTRNNDGAKFCVECGAALARSCPECGTPHQEGQRFCAECGIALAARAEANARPSAVPTTERRLVSVLFTDLVGFTTASETRDAEETRELLSRYFETARTMIERYGGTVEKFIGDAVMAVWGTPVAQEDDAERAVRTALDLVAAVPDLDSSLRARAGVLTGEAAVTLDAEGQGMVAGDLVNTASRIQSLAEPGTVLVGETTKRATEAAIAYGDAGAQELKGKSEPVQLFRALRVTAARGGALKSTGLEPPFVGRDRELRLVKELFHTTAEESKAHLVSVTGIAGHGKSRLAWEFEKYVDGVLAEIWWHRGRCLAYGDGVAYWALAEMVRMRARIAEDEPAEEALRKLRATIELHIADSEERVWLEPRLAHLLGLTERTAPDRTDLFSAWRLFFERLAEQGPCILVFEDIHWADTSLLDFVEHLLEWSRNHALFVLTLARPELYEHHPDFGKASRNATTLSLEPLHEDAMEELLGGFAPGLPDDLREQILARAEGVPLYAVETVRMLLDRGLLARKGDVYTPTGAIEALDVPETLHALVAARLDGLEPEERRLLQDASVLGKTFTAAGLSAVSGRPEAELEPLLAALVRKEVLSLQSDPRSPERGQYGFLQDLLKHVAYETLVKGERKAKHLAAAAFLEHAWGSAEQEVVEVVAAHYLDAYRAAPTADDAAEIKRHARDRLARAGERAASLAASEEAQRYFEHAAELADDALSEAGFRERAGVTAWRGGRPEHARTQLGQALELFESEGATHPAARVSARLGEVEWRLGELERALVRMEGAFEVLSGDEPDEDLAMLAVELGRLHFFAGEIDLAAQRVDRAIEIAESLWLPEVISEALNTQGLIATFNGRSEQAVALLQHALELALDHDLTAAALRAYNNLGDLFDRRDRYEEAIEVHRRGLALARKAGNAIQGWRLAGELSYCLMRTGQWEEALQIAGELPESGLAFSLSGFQAPAEIAIARGDLAWAERLFRYLSGLEASADVQDRASYFASRAMLLTAEGRFEDALRSSREALVAVHRLGPGIGADGKLAYRAGLEALLALGRLDALDELLREIEAVPPGKLAPYLRALAARYRARLADVHGEDAAVEPSFKTASATFREYDLLFELAVTQLEHGEWLVGRGRAGEAESLLTEAGGIFTRLETRPWVERLERAAVPLPA